MVSCQDLGLSSIVFVLVYSEFILADRNSPLPLSSSTLGVNHNQERVGTRQRVDLKTGKKWSSDQHQAGLVGVPVGRWRLAYLQGLAFSEAELKSLIGVIGTGAGRWLPLATFEHGLTVLSTQMLPSFFYSPWDAIIKENQTLHQNKAHFLFQKIHEFSPTYEAANYKQPSASAGKISFIIDRLSNTFLFKRGIKSAADSNFQNHNTFNPVAAWLYFAPSVFSM